MRNKGSLIEIDIKYTSRNLGNSKVFLLKLKRYNLSLKAFKSFLNCSEIIETKYVHYCTDLIFDDLNFSGTLFISS